MKSELNPSRAWSLRVASVALIGLFLASRVGVGQSALELVVSQTQEGSLELVWPASELDYELETSSTLDPDSWAPVDAFPTLLDDLLRLPFAQSTDPVFYRLRVVQPPVIQVASTSPNNGSDRVAVTRETIFRFSEPLSATTSLSTETVVATFGEEALQTRMELSMDRKTLSLFYNSPLPGGSRIMVTLDGDLLEDALGRAVDADNDGQPGGKAALTFNTLNISPITGTAVVGQVLASELGEENGQPINVPLEGVKITLDGKEDEVFTFTDAEGNFKLEPVPGGEFFVHIDGRTAVGSQYPNGDYYPFVGKSWVSVPGYDNTLAGGTGIVHLPLVKSGTLKPVSETEDTEVTFIQEVVEEFPDFAGVSVTVPANSLFSDNGTRGGSVGIAPVPPDRLPGQLPEMLQFPLVITVQTDGASNFDVPAPAKFPNLPDPITGKLLPPGAKTGLWSFNHDSGRWEVQGSMTISEDGLYAVSDPGVGIRAPGWHGTNPGGSGGGGGGGPDDNDDDNDDDDPDDPDDPDPDDPDPDDPCEKKLNKASIAVAECASSFLTAIPGVGCAAGIVVGVVGSGANCYVDFDTCDQAIISETASTLLGCVPVIGGVGGIAYNCLYGAGLAHQDYKNCDSNPLSDNLRDDAIYVLQVSPPNIPHNPLQEQAELWAAGAAFYEIVYGDKEWTLMDPEEWPVAEPFFEMLEAFGDPSSEDGKGFSITEKTALQDLPRPSNITEQIVNATVDRIDRMNRSQLTGADLDPVALKAAADNLVATIEELQSRGWTTTWSGILDTLDELANDQDRAFVGGGSTNSANGDTGSFDEEPLSDAPYTLQSNLYFRVTNLSSMFEQRGKLSATGEFDGLFLSPDTYYMAEYAHPKSGRYAITFFRSGGPGSNIEIPRSILLTDESGDTDGDGLPDTTESVLGTLVDNPDTDNDGVPDGAELENGTNPLDGLPIAAGILASVETRGKAVDIAALGDLIALTNDVSGVALVDVTNILEPSVINQFGIGIGTKLVAGSFNRLAVVGQDNKLRIINVSDPLNPVTERVLEFFGSVNAVQALGRHVYVGLSSFRIQKFDLITGNMIWEWTDADAAVHDIAISRGNVYALTASSLQIFPDSGETPATLGTVEVEGTQSPLELGRKLFVGGDYAYVGYFTGYTVIDVSNSVEPMIVAEPPSPQLAIHDLVLDGNGRMLATTSFAGESTLRVTVFDTSDPLEIDQGLIDFATPGAPRSLVLHRGVALVADSLGGMQVINYFGADTGSVAPDVSFQAGTGFDLSMAEAEAGQTTWIGVDATDDVQIRSVDLLINGRRAALDSNYPYEVNFRIPFITNELNSFTIQAVAIDTGGNRTETEIAVINLVDTLPPAPIGAFPSEDLPQFSGEVDLIQVTFDDQINPVTLTSESFKVIEAGDDGLFDTADDIVVMGERSFETEFQYAALTLPTPLNKGSYRISISQSVSDYTGNTVESPHEFLFEIWDTNQWVSEAASSSWNIAENWSEGSVRINDRLIIDVPELEAVTTAWTKSYEIQWLRSEERFTLRGRNLTIAYQAVLNGRFQWQDQSTITGPGMTYANGGMEITGTSNKWVRGGHTFINNGVLEWLEGSVAIQDSNTTFLNSETGTIELLNDAFASTVSSNDNTAEFVNEGTIFKRGDALFQFQSTRLVNNGTIDIENGELGFQILGHDGEGEYIVRENGKLVFNYSQARKTSIDGPVTLHEGAQINFFYGWGEFTETSSVSGPGDVSVNRSEIGLPGPSLMEVYGEYDVRSTVISGSSQADFHSLARSENITLGGTIGGTGDLESTGDVVLEFGEIIGGGAVRIFGTLTTTDSGSIDMRNRVLEIYGDAILNSSNLSPDFTLYGPENGRIEIMEGATWTQKDDFVIHSQGTFSESWVFLNKGTFTKTGEGISGIRMPFENRGLVVLEEGTLRIDTNYIQKSGETRFFGGTLLRGQFVSDPQFEGGLVTGAGVVALGAADVVNMGAIFDPGDSQTVGKITVDGGYIQESAGATAIDIFGTAQTEGNWDQLVVDRFFTLDGTLEVRLADGFVPDIGEVYLILDGESNLSGEFATVTGLEIAADRRFELNYTDHDVTLTVVAIP